MENLTKKLMALLAAGYSLREFGNQYHVWRTGEKLVIKLGHENYTDYVIGRVDKFTNGGVFTSKIIPLQLFCISSREEAQNAAS